MPKPLLLPNDPTTAQIKAYNGKSLGNQWLINAGEASTYWLEK